MISTAFSIYYFLENFAKINIVNTRLVNILISGALLLYIIGCAKQETENKSMDMNIKLTWTVVTNMLVGESSCRAAFIFTDFAWPQTSSDISRSLKLISGVTILWETIVQPDIKKTVTIIYNDIFFI